MFYRQIILLITTAFTLVSHFAKAQVLKETARDIDGNIYHIVKIGSQTWMVENLKVTRYRNGDKIPNVTDNSQWDTLRRGAWCYYENDSSKNEVYGKLYNYYAVSDKRKLAPPGWHIPSNAEWDTLINHLGGMWVAGGKMKEAGTAHWQKPNIAATNESGFTALPGGFRFDYGEFFFFGQTGYWWNHRIGPGDDEKGRSVSYENGILFELFSFLVYGMSVRCIKD